MKYLKSFNSTSARNEYIKSNFYTPRIYHVNNEPIFYEEQYLELEYISSTQTGGQYIDLGCKLLENTDDIEIDIKFNLHGQGKVLGNANGDKQWTLIGNQSEASPYPGFALRYYVDSYNIYYCEFMAKWAISNSTLKDKRYYPYYLQGQSITSNYSATYTNQIYNKHIVLDNIPASQCMNLNTMLFCGLNANDQPWRFAYADLYYLKITKGGQVIRDLIPVIKVKTNEVGLYDKEHHVFYKSQGNEPFVPHYKVPIFRNIYKKVEYITNTYKGAQYIDLGCKLFENTDDIQIDIKFIIKGSGYNAQANDYAVLLSSEREIDPYPGFVLRKSSISMTGQNGLNNGVVMTTRWEGSQDTVYAGDNNIYYSIYMNGNFKPETYGTTVIGELYEKTFVFNNIPDSQIHNINTILFGSYYKNGNPHYYSKSILYYLKITKGGQVIRDLIPVERITDHQIGLYDMQNDVFYGASWGRNDIYEPLIQGEYIN